MDLLVIKNGDAYLRIKEGAYTAVGLDKASVYPHEKLMEVTDILDRVKARGFRQAAIYRLIVTEAPLEKGQSRCN